MAQARDRDCHYKSSICLNAEKLNVTVYLNDEALAPSWKVISNKTYHLFIISADTWGHNKVRYRLSANQSMIVFGCKT